MIIIIMMQLGTALEEVQWTEGGEGQHNFQNYQMKTVIRHC